MNLILNDLKEAIIQANGNRVEKLLDRVKGRADFDAVFTRCICPALDALCALIQSRQSAIPELLMGLKQVHRIAESINDPDKIKKQKKIVIGVIEGDVHDMGKNVIRDVCHGYGFDVIDLGKNVSPSVFAEAADMQRADVACLSTMLSTTIETMEQTIKTLKMSRPGIRVLIGGAFMDAGMATRVGADGYAENAATVMAEIERVLE